MTFENFVVTISYDEKQQAHMVTAKMPHKDWEEMVKLIKIGLRYKEAERIALEWSGGMSG